MLGKTLGRLVWKRHNGSEENMKHSDSLTLLMTGWHRCRNGANSWSITSYNICYAGVVETDRDFGSRFAR